MIREEEIIEAGIEYNMQNSPCCIGGDNFYEQAMKFNRNKSFEAGAKWADEHPESPWISVENDLPCNHDELIYFGTTVIVLVRLKNGNVLSNYMSRVENSYKWSWARPVNITHWMLIPKLND